MFSESLSCLDVLGMQIYPCCTLHLIMICAGDLEYLHVSVRKLADLFLVR